MWKYSRLRFYILNVIWNYKFWLFAEKMYKNHTYEVIDENISLENVDITGKILYRKKRVSHKRFIGYRYKGFIYLDNPGLKHTVDKDTWEAWKRKGLIRR